MHQKEQSYSHVQRGFLHRILFVASLVCLGLAGRLSSEPHSLWIFLAVAGVCVMLSLATATLTVRDAGDRLIVQFGPVPLFRKSIPYARMTDVEKTRSSLLSGWGIHYTTRGVLWNIGGFDCVRITMGHQSVLVGTDDPDGLVAWLRSRMSR